MSRCSTYPVYIISIISLDNTDFTWSGKFQLSLSLQLFALSVAWRHNSLNECPFTLFCLILRLIIFVHNRSCDFHRMMLHLTKDKYYDITFTGIGEFSRNKPSAPCGKSVLTSQPINSFIFFQKLIIFLTHSNSWNPLSSTDVGHDKKNESILSSVNLYSVFKDIHRTWVIYSFLLQIINIFTSYWVYFL